MGKKKPQKTKEISVAIAEASSTIDEKEQQQQPQVPRKRGRPRKIIVKMESEEEKTQAEEGIESSMEKGNTNEEEGASSSACMRVATQEEIMQLPKEPSRSRARRKSKPRKTIKRMSGRGEKRKERLDKLEENNKWNKTIRSTQQESHVPMNNVVAASAHQSMIRMLPLRAT
ncbi:hypothetical protein CR513_22415, partial [Mucuna pruriens]